jgi:hypothetical protein
VAAACLLGLVVIGGVASDEHLQRDNWRGAATALGPPVPGGLIVAPATALIPLGYYVPGLRVAPDPSTLVPTTQISYVDLAERTPGELSPPRRAELPPALPNFSLAGRIDAPTFTVVQLRATAPEPVTPAALERGLDGGPALVFTTP